MTRKDVKILEKDFINFIKNIKMIYIHQYIIVIKYYGVDKYNLFYILNIIFSYKIMIN